MNVKEKTKKELEQRIEKLENIIASEGVGSDYLEKAERIQRDLNLALLLGTSAAVLGISAWAIYKMKDE
ncbi:MAG: hypothetical protein WD735_04975 [Balneolaceae bacterium]